MGITSFYRGLKNVVISIIVIMVSVWIIFFALIILYSGPHCGQGSHLVDTGRRVHDVRDRTPEGTIVYICQND